jgi:hypothetical protein
MNEMNSLTHSCIHSLASFAIFALSGNAVFIIRATGAKLRMLASGYPSFFPLFEVRFVSGDEEEAGEGDWDVWDMFRSMTAVTQSDSSVCAGSQWLVDV